MILHFFSTVDDCLMTFGNTLCFKLVCRETLNINLWTWFLLWSITVRMRNEMFNLKFKEVLVTWQESVSNKESLILEKRLFLDFSKIRLPPPVLEKCGKKQYVLEIIFWAFQTILRIFLFFPPKNSKKLRKFSMYSGRMSGGGGYG